MLKSLLLMEMILQTGLLKTSIEKTYRSERIFEILTGFICLYYDVRYLITLPYYKPSETLDFRGFFFLC